jgi:DNA-binding protein HU-beta
MHHSSGKHIVLTVSIAVALKAPFAYNQSLTLIAWRINTMQKTELINQVAKETNVSQAQAAKLVNATLNAIVGALKGGDKVTLTGFGTFEVRKTAARMGTNPRTRQKINIPAGRRASFSAGSLLREAVSGKTAKKGNAKPGSQQGRR